MPRQLAKERLRELRLTGGSSPCYPCYSLFQRFFKTDSWKSEALPPAVGVTKT
jgi:hypothetical protein